jgi:hypothetical protein
MQLPRGTFREIRKSVAIESLLQSLDKEIYSGIANISSKSLSGTLVFKSGKCILVKVGNSRGDIGWGELWKAGNEEMAVDALLSVLNDAQIELALEFNKPCRILVSDKVAQSRVVPQPVPEQKPAPSSESLKHPAKPVPATQTTRAAPTPRAPAHAPPLHPHIVSTASRSAPPPTAPPAQLVSRESGKRPRVVESPQKDSETGVGEDDFDTFDSMDINSMTEKIRTDCKTMIKQLDLEHLMEH